MGELSKHFINSIKNEVKYEDEQKVLTRKINPESKAKHMEILKAFCLKVNEELRGTGLAFNDFEYNIDNFNKNHSYHSSIANLNFWNSRDRSAAIIIQGLPSYNHERRKMTQIIYPEKYIIHFARKSVSRFGYYIEIPEGSPDIIESPEEVVYRLKDLIRDKLIEDKEPPKQGSWFATLLKKFN